MQVMESVFKIVVPPEWHEEGSKHGANLSKETQVDTFSLIINEGELTQKGDPLDKKLPSKQKGASLWR